MKSAELLSKIFALYQEIEQGSAEWRKDSKECNKIVAVQNLLRQVLQRAEINLSTGLVRGAVAAHVPPVAPPKQEPEPQPEAETNQNLVMADNSKKGLDKARKSKKDADSSN
jgi:hypothetical protein